MLVVFVAGIGGSGPSFDCRLACSLWRKGTRHSLLFTLHLLINCSVCARASMARRYAVETGQHVFVCGKKSLVRFLVLASQRRLLIIFVHC